MGKRERVAVMVAVFLVVALVCAGAVSAAAGSGAEEPTESTVSNETTLPADAAEESETTLPADAAEEGETTLPADTVEATDATLPTEGTESEASLSDWDNDPTTEVGPFGQWISALRHEGDHTPAAVIKGKHVPGWNPEKHAAAPTKTTVVTPPEAGADDPSEGDGDTELEIRPAGSSEKSGHKPSKAAATLKGKKAPGHGK